MHQQLTFKLIYFSAKYPVTLVKSVEYFMTNTFKDQLYDSCKNVYNPTTGTAIASMCGVWGPDCTAERWLQFMGDVSQLAPFQIDYVFTDEEQDGMKPHSNNPVPCNKPVPGKEFLIF